MSVINPGPQALGIASPVLGPWFDNNDETLAVPGARLEVVHSFTVAAGTAWWPPAGGTLSLAVSTPTRPKPLRALTDALGNAAFSDNMLVALFTLLPEVEDRLEVLSAMLPRPDGGPGGPPARARVRALAIELPDAQSSRLGYFGTGSAQDFGLVANTDDTLGNGSLAMCDLKRPGLVPPVARQVLASFPSGLAVTIWAFDAEGFAIDPGAVANWWWAIAAGNVPPWNSTLADPTTWVPNMWADALHMRTCATMPNLSFRVVNPHRGVIDAALRGRLTIAAGAASAVPGNADLYTANATNGATLGFTAAPTGTTPPDTAPFPLLAMLPIGNHGPALTIWNGGPTGVPGHPGAGPTTVARDYVEVSALDAESFVCGIQRGVDTVPPSPAGRRAADQNRVATRINVLRSQVQPMSTASSVAWAFAQLPDGSSRVNIIAPAYDHDWGARTLTGLPVAGANAPVLPNVLPPLQVFPLVGGGAASGNTVGEQQVVIRLALDLSSNLAGAWVRIYPNKLDVLTGRRVAQPGGAGRFGTAAAVGIETLAHVVVTLPAGEDGGGLALTGVDVLIFDGVNPPRLYADQRFARPEAVDGETSGMIAFADVSKPNQLLLVCDLGIEIDTSQTPLPQIPSGATLLARFNEPGTLDETFTLVDRNTVPLLWLLPDTAARMLLAGDVIALTSPAFVEEERGNLRPATDPASNAATVGLAATVNNQGRNGVSNLGSAGAPLPTMQRLELVGLVNAGAVGNNAAAVGSAPALARWHEVPPITAGNPTAPAGPDVHGAGVRIVGGSITDVADVMRDRLFPATDDLINDAGSNPLPVQAMGPGAWQWSAVLKTVAQGVEGEPFLFEYLDIAEGSIERAYDAMVTAGVLSLPTGANATNAIRAFGRRVVNALGRQETLYALNAAIGRAERLIYIETPALDGEAVVGPVTGTGSPLAWLDTLIARLGNVPGLHVALCVPTELLPGTPKPLTWVRNELWHRALDRLLATAGDRIAVFSPGAGPLRAARMASTVVVVDDVWALVGNTHLSRRGLSFDSSLAVAFFDEATRFSRSTLVSGLRVQLAADRLGATPAQIPLIAQEFVAAIRRLAEVGGAGRLAVGTIARAPAAGRPTDTDLKLWNRDGSVSGDTDWDLWLTEIAAHVTTN